MLNKVMLIGNLGKDPEVRTIPNGTKVANFSVATTESYTDKQGNKVDKTEWTNCVLWKGLADISDKYLRKGSKIYIEGKLVTRSWEKDGQKRYTTEVVAHTMKMLGGKQSQSESSTPYQSGSQAMPEAPEDDLPF